MKIFHFIVSIVLMYGLGIQDTDAQSGRLPVNTDQNNPYGITINFNTPQSFNSKSAPLDLCVPQYSTGCAEGDGFTSFAVQEIQNYGSGCANLNGNGWSQYFSMGPAILLPGETYDFLMQTGYGNQHAAIWLDFNDDLALTSDEKILSDFVMESAGQLYTVAITIPSNAIPGQHIMRARTNYGAVCNDPCTNYTYGEAEDYYVIIGVPAFGSLDGMVTAFTGGAPVSGVTISATGTINYSTTTGSDGTYSFDNVLIGEYTVHCTKNGYNPAMQPVTIEENVLATVNFQITHPVISVSPLAVTKTLAPDSTGEETVTIQNTGDGPLDWSSTLVILSDNSKEFMDLQFQYPLAGYNEVGVETNGLFIYTTVWNGPGILKYDMDGNYIGTFTIPGVSFLKDLAFDGTFFYGGAASTIVYQMDFDSQTLVGTITAPTIVRAIAYDADDDAFYANNWGSDIVKFDKSGNLLGSFAAGPFGDNYYGFAYDNESFGGPYLWGYAQVGATQNQIIQIQLPDGNETGYSLDVATKLNGTITGIAGGLFTHPNIVTGKWTLGGIVQGQCIWGLELTDAANWIGINPLSGTVPPGSSDEMTVYFDATDLLPGIYEAEIHFASDPAVGSPVVDITLTVSGEAPDPPYDFTGSLDCETFDLCWTVNQADSCSVYANGSWVANTTEYCYTFAGPGWYGCYVTAWLNGIESMPSAVFEFEILWPSGLEPINFTITDIVDHIVSVSWNVPIGCAIPDSYNVYRNGNKINELPLTELNYSDTVDFGGTYTYYATTVYYFGESGASNSQTVVITSAFNQQTGELFIFPNPAKRLITIKSDLPILSLIMLNNLSRIVLENNPVATELQLNVSGLEPGIYFLNLQTRENTMIRKVIIE